METKRRGIRIDEGDLERFALSLKIGDIRSFENLPPKRTIAHIIEARARNLITDDDLDKIVDETIEHSFPEKLEEQTAAALESVNGEAKQVQLLITEDYPMTCSGIRNSVADISELDKSEIPDPSHFKQYALNNFVPAGFVSVLMIGDVFGTNSICNFRITEAGLVYAQPIAAYSLWTAVENEISFHDLLGSVAAEGSSAQVNRGKISKAITEGYDALEEIAREVELDHGDVREHICHMEETGFASFEEEKRRKEIESEYASTTVYTTLITPTEKTSLVVSIYDNVREALQGGPVLEQMEEIREMFQDKTILGEYSRKGLELYNDAIYTRRTAEERQDRILSILKGNGGSTLTRIRKDLGWTRSRTFYHLSSLINEGILVKTNGVYTIT